MPRPLRLAIDASRTTVARVTGTEHYALELLRSLIHHNETLSTPHQLGFYFRDVPAEDLFPQSEYVQEHVVTIPRAWTHLRFAAALWQTYPDVTFVPAHTLPFLFPGKAVVTVHDLGYKHFPEAHPAQQRRYLDWTTRYSAARATHILADSQATADDLTRFYSTPSDKIHVVYPGVAAPPLHHEVDIHTKYNLPARYFLFIGTLQPRKNIERLVQAFHDWQTQQPQHAIGLVLAGKAGWLFDEAWIKNVRNVHLTGYIDDVDKGALMAKATALLFPSLYEGFGFPVLEAMHCGTPVIASTTSSLPELVSEAGLLVDPLNRQAITAAITQLVDDEALQAQLITQGHKQANTFTWVQAAQQTMQVLELAGYRNQR